MVTLTPTMLLDLTLCPYALCSAFWHGCGQEDRGGGFRLWQAQQRGEDRGQRGADQFHLGLLSCTESELQTCPMLITELLSAVKIVGSKRAACA